MSDNCQECPVLPRVEALEASSKNHGERIGKLETATAVQDTKLDNIDGKLDELTAMVKELTGKAGKRWDGLVDKVLWAVAGAVVAFLLAKVGL